MPDWITHFFIAYLIIWTISKIPKYDAALRKYYWFFIIGMLSPDIERFINLIAQQVGNEFFISIAVTITDICHSLLGIVIISLFITSFFPHENDTKYIFLTVFIGAFGHLLTDAIMWPWAGQGIHFFYPLTGPEFAFSFHLVWPGGFVPLIVTSCIVVGTIIVDLIQGNFSVLGWRFQWKGIK